MAHEEGVAEWFAANRDLCGYLQTKPQSEWASIRVGESLMAVAARQRNDVSLRMLLAAGMSVVDSDALGSIQPIHIACMMDSSRMVELFCCAGADLGVMTQSGKRPLDYALSNIASETWRVLVANGARVTRVKTAQREVREYAAHVACCRRGARALWSLRLPGVDKFLLRQIALALWAERY